MAWRGRLLGLAILACSIAFMVFYIWLLFLSPEEWQFWALRIPVAVIVLAAVGVAAWIGYTMASTPPPRVVEEREGSTQHVEART
ncbi:MAG: transcriptional regulator [Thermoprotei archaeon]|nr:MAG: transcriptional regulator [Thermoprotei archaeon]RLF23155.1 MAG: transcriptional regulator [Thermoprotei archaeon]